MKEIIGLTGPTGAGKSTARNIFKECGYSVIDADVFAHQLYDTNIDCLVAVVDHFSCLVLNDKGKINRKALGRIVFSNPTELQNLNKIIFPYLRKALIREVRNMLPNSEHGVVIDGATIIESKCSDMCSNIISVVADEKIRMNRIMERDNISIWEAGKRISAQQMESFYTDNSDYVIKNEGSKQEMEREIKYILGRITEKRRNEHFTEVMI